MTDLTELRPASDLHHRCVFNTPFPVDWGDERNFRFEPVYPEPTVGVLEDNGFGEDWLRAFLDVDDDIPVRHDAVSLAKARELFRGTQAEAEWKECFLPQWNHYFPVELVGVSPDDAANLIFDLAPDVVLVRFDRQNPTYGLAAHAVGTNNLWPFLIAFVCCGAVPPLYLAQQIDRGNRIPEDRARRVWAVYNAVGALRRYIASTVEQLLLKQETIDMALARREVLEGKLHTGPRREP